MVDSTQHFDGSSTYINEMMQQIYNNGPVVASMKVYQDFYQYGSGVYKYVSGALEGGHAVRVIGWGSQLVNGVNTPYWLIANSWGKGWGEQGFFKIRRGTNEVGIESNINFGTPWV